MSSLWPTSEQAIRLLRRRLYNVLWKAGRQALGCQPLAQALRYHVCVAAEPRGFE